MADEVINDLLLLPMKPHEPLKTDVMAAAKLKSIYRLSYADAFAVALAEKLEAEICTGDPEILNVGGTIKVLRLSTR